MPAAARVCGLQNGPPGSVRWRWPRGWPGSLRRRSRERWQWTRPCCRCGAAPLSLLRTYRRSAGVHHAILPYDEESWVGLIASAQPEVDELVDAGVVAFPIVSLGLLDTAAAANDCRLAGSTTLAR